VGYLGQPNQPDYLPGVVTEIQTLAEFLPASDLLWGEDASVSRILAQVGGYGLVHLAGHAQYDSREPVHSGIPLAGDRWLRAADLYLHPGLLQGATVVLSSCESGRGRATGQEVLGLTTAFLVAGASGVVAGLWRVDDAATVELMTRFYRVMIEEKTGVAAALQQAQQTMLFNSPYNHPYYWAPFTLTGASRHPFLNR
jgi:CHAT domain-containing protein